MVGKPDRCRMCGGVLVQLGRGRPRLYDGLSCRRLAEYARREEAGDLGDGGFGALIRGLQAAGTVQARALAERMDAGGYWAE